MCIPKHNGEKMQTWHKMVIIGLSIIMIMIAGTFVYINYFAKKRLIISTTTSLYETDLLKTIETAFESKYPMDVQFISAGTGIAIEHAKNGDADLILVHSPSQEEIFLKEGYGVSRKIIAYNFFTIVGPQEDPAQITGLNVSEALKKIADYGRKQTDANNKVWYSRGDNSGTHSKEQSLWKSAGFNYTTLSTESWYASAGAGMGETLLKAEEKSAYTLSDIGTYLKYREKDGLITLKSYLSETHELLNVYSAIAVNQTRINHVNFDVAIIFMKFLISDEYQQLIEDFGKNDYGQSGRLFHAAADLVEQNSTEQMAQWIRKYAFLENPQFSGQFSECPPQYRDQRHPELYSYENET